MTYNCDADTFRPDARGAYFGTAFLTGVIELITRASAERRATRALLTMDDYLLRDIGISRQQVEELVRTGRIDHDETDAPHGAWNGTK